MDKDRRIEVIKEIEEDLSDIQYWLRKKVDIEELPDSELNKFKINISRAWIILNKKTRISNVKV